MRERERECERERERYAYFEVRTSSKMFIVICFFDVFPMLFGEVAIELSIHR